MFAQAQFDPTMDKSNDRASVHRPPKPRCLVVASAQCISLVYTPEIQRSLALEAEFISPPVPTEELIAHPACLREVEVLCTTWGAPALDARLLAEAPHLNTVLHGAGTVRSLVTEALWTRGIAVSSAYAANSIPVAEFTLGAILLANKRTFHHMRMVDHRRHLPEGEALVTLRNDCMGNYGTVVGLVSFGMVGRMVRDRLRPFDLRVLVYDPFVEAEDAARLGVELVSLPDLFSRSDVVSLHTPLLDATRGMIRGEHFASMKTGATFINTARGGLICEDEMISVLRQRPDLQALLDVTWPEPPATNSPLYDLPNVFLTPHMAGSLGGECRRLGETVVSELRRIVSGEPLRWQVTPEQLATMA